MTEERNQTDARADALVSQAYRDLADERTPEHLDRTILRAAAKAARPRYSRFIAWTRPMAWAATVMLSVALVLEVTNSPSPGVVSFDETIGTFEVQSPEADAKDDGPVDSPEDSVVPASELTKKQSSDMRQKAAAIAEQEIAPQQPEARERAELLSDAAFSAPVTDCSQDAVATPQAWLECIVALEDADRDDAAREQRALLAEAFPDFDAR
jgi:cytoskeletal protein RodZ